MRAVDCSFDPLFNSEAGCLKRSGWPVFIQCLWTGATKPLVAHANLQTAYDTGMPIAAYISLTHTSTGVWHVVQGLRGLSQELWDALEFVAIDVELPGIRATEIWQAAVEVAALGKQPVIYTSYNAWRDYVIPGNPMGFGRIPLWNAYWDEHPDSDFAEYPYGGWGEAAIEQWSGGTYICGQFVDRNEIFDESLIGGEHMPTQEYEELKGRIDYLAGAVRKIGAGEHKVPIWPVGLVTLKEIWHRAWHGWERR